MMRMVSPGLAATRSRNAQMIDVPAKSANLNPEIGHFRAIYLRPEELEPDIAKWLPIFQSVFR